MQDKFQGGSSNILDCAGQYSNGHTYIKMTRLFVTGETKMVTGYINGVATTTRMKPMDTAIKTSGVQTVVWAYGPPNAFCDQWLTGRFFVFVFCFCVL